MSDIDWNEGEDYLQQLGGKVEVFDIEEAQCNDSPTQGMYVVHHPELGLCRFEPSTKMQANIWCNAESMGKTGQEYAVPSDARREHVKWFCYVCAKVMPLG